MQGSLTNRKIVCVRALTEEELEYLDWQPAPLERPAGLQLDDGTLLIASQDFEGNGPGVMFQLTDDKIFAHTMARKGPSA